MHKDIVSSYIQIIHILMECDHKLHFCHVVNKAHLCAVMFVDIMVDDACNTDFKLCSDLYEIYIMWRPNIPCTYLITPTCNTSSMMECEWVLLMTYAAIIMLTTSEWCREHNLVSEWFKRSWWKNWLSISKSGCFSFVFAT